MRSGMNAVAWPFRMRENEKRCMAQSNVVLCPPVRSATDTCGGSLKAMSPSKMGAEVIRAMERAALKGADIDTIVMGQVVQAGAKMNPARQAMVGAGIPIKVPALTVNRVCGSSTQAIASAAIIPIQVPGGAIGFKKDEHNRPDTTMQSLAKLKPAFRRDGTITAGNAPELNSAAAAVIVADAKWVEKRNLQPLARPVSYGLGAVEPGMFGLGPVPAARQALERAGWRIGELERIEVSEGFAAHRNRADPGTRAVGEHRQRRGRGDRPRPADQCDQWDPW
ncbi:hypothetical protein [Terripilifer ovatus]|uniref:thiolase family protein n=1 Tax=Terripilifer ovatus TaxID=3032367 RepID=UPI003AB9B559